MTTSDRPPDPSTSPGPDLSPPVLRLRGPRASTVITHRFPADQADAFMAWQHEATALAGAYPGYQATEVYPPTGDGDGDEWVIIIHFDDEMKLQAWLDAPERTALLAKLPDEALGFRQQTMPTGFGSWVAGQAVVGTRVPHWKSFLLVPVALYPVVMLRTLIVSPRTTSLGTAFATLLGTALSVAILEWAVMPLVNRGLAPWLRAHGKDGRAVSVVGGALIGAAVLGMALLFWAVSG